jgi:hypothetical protein
MNWRISVLALMLAVGAVFSFSPAALAELPPIASIDDVKPQLLAFEAAKRDAPLVIRTKDEAAKYFDEDALARLNEEVDFEKQFVLVFAWRGSGQDRVTHAVAESFPEQIFFTLTPGRTKDLRQHVHVYALRSNVKWSLR